MDRWGSVVVWCSSTSLVGVSVVSCQCGHGGSRVVHRWGCSSRNEEPHPRPIVGTEDAPMPMPMRHCRCAVFMLLWQLLEPIVGTAEDASMSMRRCHCRCAVAEHSVGRRRCGYRRGLCVRIGLAYQQSVVREPFVQPRAVGLFVVIVSFVDDCACFGTTGSNESIATRCCWYCQFSSVSKLLVSVLEMVLVGDDADIQFVGKQGACLLEGRWCR